MNIEKFNRAKEIDEELKCWENIFYKLGDAKKVKIVIVPKEEDEWLEYSQGLESSITLNKELIQEIKDRVEAKIKSLENEFEEI